MLEIPIIQKPLDNHIEFECNFKVLMKIIKVCVGMVVILPMWWPPHQFDICTMLNLMSNSFSSRKLMKLHENMVEIRPI
jgi:hypothetical protein